MSVYNTVRALERGLDILRIVNEFDGIKVQEIVDRTGLSRPTVFRFLESLESLGYVAKSPSTGQWRPTMDCNLLSAGFAEKSWIGQIAVPKMERLGGEILWPLDLVTNDGDAMRVRETTHRTSPFSFDHGMVGRRIPILHTASGRVYLAFCTDEEREILFDMLRKSRKPEHALIHNQTMINRILAKTRERGFGFRNQGYRNHTQSISVPIFVQDRVLAALTVICLNSALSFDDMVRKFEVRLREAAAAIGAGISTGGSEPLSLKRPLPQPGQFEREECGAPAHGSV